MTLPFKPRLDTDTVLRGYASGIFPMSDNAKARDIFWVEPRRRGVVPLKNFHLSRSLAKLLRSERFALTVDTAFDAVLAGCSEAAPDRPETWINPLIANAYRELHINGHAHSIEAWTADGTLAGGLYGVRIGGAFFGESMFTRVRDASKCALAALVARLRYGGFTLLDTQFLTEHLATFGAGEVTTRTYRAQLAAAIGVSADFFAFDTLGLPSELTPPTLPASTVSGPVSGNRIVQLLTQIS